MPSTHKPTIAIFTSAEGHYSIAQAIEQTLKEKYKVVIFYERDSLFDLYTPIYQLFPQAYALPYHLSKQKNALKMMQEIFENRYKEKIESFFRKHRPVALINTYFMYTPSLERLHQLTQVPLINVFTDPRTFHPLLVAKNATANLVFDDLAGKDTHIIEPAATVISSGWFVRDEFEAEYDTVARRKELKLDPDKLTILIASGSEGTTTIMKILPTLLLVKKPIQVVVACGGNKTMLQGVNAFQKILKKIKNPNSIVGLGFTHQLHKYMQAADLVVGKAGPNTLFECVATQTPFFAITHVTGQEDGNLDLINAHKLGYVEEHLFKAQSLLKDIIDEPQQLAKFQEPIKTMADYNRNAKKILLKILAENIV